MQYFLQSLQNNWQEASPKIIKLTARRERGQKFTEVEKHNQQFDPYVRQTFRKNSIVL